MGNRLDGCLNMVLSAGPDCSVFGAACVTGANGKDVCAVAGAPACTQPIFPGGLRCDGNVSVLCSGGHELRDDCAARGRSCLATASNGLPNSCGLGNDCDDFFTTTCDGGTLTFCYDGVIGKWDCKANGFSRCDPSGRCST
jgi:hypothetical protein